MGRVCKRKAIALAILSLVAVMAYLWAAGLPAQPAGAAGKDLETTIGVTYSPSAAISAVNVPLVAGWNLQSWKADRCQEMRLAVQNLIAAGVLNVMASFVARTQSWLLFDPIAPEALNTLRQLCPGDIAWLNVSANATWVQGP